MNKKFFQSQNVSTKKNSSLWWQKILLYCYIGICKVMGLSPWKVNISWLLRNFNDQRSDNYLLNPYSVSKYGKLYNVFLIMVIATYSIVTSKLSLWKTEYVDTVMANVIQNFVISFGIIHVVSVWIIYILYDKKIVDISNKLYKLNSYLVNCKCYEFETNRHSFIIFIGNTFACTSILVIGLILYPSHAEIFWIISCLISSWILIQYALFLNYIYQLYKSINNTIIKLGKIDPDIPLKILFVKRAPLHESIIVDVSNINYVNLKLNEICDEISNFYAVPTLLALIYFILSTILSVYLMILSAINTHGITVILIHLDTFMWFSLVAFDFITLTTNVTRIIRESKNTALNLHLLLDRCTLNIEVQETLIEFSHDLLHRTVEFSTYGIINIDSSLLQSISGTMVTYLIILIQFHCH